MAVPRVSSIRTRLVAVAGFAALGLLVPVQPAAQSTELPPTVSVEPTSGVPGSSALATLEGFEQCVPVDDAPGLGGTVTVAWDGDDPLGTVELESGQGALSFIVAESASLEEHVVTATCTTDKNLADATTFLVTEPSEQPVLVPNVIGMTESDAVETIKEALLLSQVVGSGDTVVAQDPPANTEAERDSTVTIDLGVAPPELAEVPDLTNLTLDQARQSLSETGLLLGSSSGEGPRVHSQSPLPFSLAPLGSTVDVTMRPAVRRLVRVPDLSGLPVVDAPEELASVGLHLAEIGGQGDVIRDQSPIAGTLVPRGTSVSVSVEPGVQPPPLVVVPDVVGRSVEDARDLLESVQLTLNAASDEGSVVDQAPEPGTLVPQQSIVSVQLEDATNLWVFVVAGFGLVGAGVAVTSGYRTIQARRTRLWLREHVTVEAGRLVTDPTVVESREPADDLVLAVQGSIDEGTHAVKGVEK